MTDEPIRGMSPIAGLIEEFAATADDYEKRSKAAWEAKHKEEMQAFQRKFGTMMIAKGEDLYHKDGLI